MDTSVPDVLACARGDGAETLALLGLFQPPYARLKTGWLGSVVKLARRVRD